MTNRAMTFSGGQSQTISVCADGDLFADDIPDESIDLVFAVMALNPLCPFQVLTEHSKRMRDYLTERDARHRERKDAVEVAGMNMVLAGAASLTRPTSWPLPNVWLGVSAEDQASADERIPDLLAAPAAVRFLSAEPLLERIDIRRWMSDCYECGASCGRRLPSRPNVEECPECGIDIGPETTPTNSDGCPKCGSSDLDAVCPDCGHYMVHQHPDTPVLDWVVAGGQSGPGARPTHPEWVRSLRDQCQAVRVPFQFRRWGDWAPSSSLLTDTVQHSLQECVWRKGAWTASMCDVQANEADTMNCVGKDNAGRTLDGRTWDEMPKVAAQ